MIPVGNRNITLKRYYRSIRNHLPSSRKLKAKVLAEIECNINAYLLENPSADITSIIARFGAPEQIAVAYVDELATPELLQKLRIRKWVIGSIASVLAIVLLVWFGVVGWAIIREINNTGGTFNEQEPITSSIQEE